MAEVTPHFGSALAELAARAGGVTATTRWASLRGLVCAVVALAAAAPGAHAQIAWDAPRMIGPDTPSGFGAYWMRAGALPGDGDAAYGTLSLPGTGGAISLRGGVGNGAGEEPAVFGGIEARAPITRHTDTQPLDVEWHAGVGMAFGQYQLASIPMGVSAGRSWSSGSVWFSPMSRWARPPSIGEATKLPTRSS